MVAISILKSGNQFGIQHKSALHVAKGIGHFRTRREKKTQRTAERAFVVLALPQLSAAPSPTRIQALSPCSCWDSCWKKAPQNARFSWICAAFFPALLVQWSPRHRLLLGARSPCSFQAQENGAGKMHEPCNTRTCSWTHMGTDHHLGSVYRTYETAVPHACRTQVAPTGESNMTNSETRLRLWLCD